MQCGGDHCIEVEYFTMSVRSGGRRNSISMSVDGFEDDGDEKDETKRKSRNLSEKKRRDQFNMLVTELGTMVSPNNRKMDKTTVLKTTIAFLKQHNEMSIRSQAEEIQTDWKPQFLSNEEFTHLMLEALDGFIIVLGTDGHILYTSESMASLLGYMPTSLHNTTLYEIVSDNDKIPLYNTLNMSASVDTCGSQQLKLLLHIRRSNLSSCKESLLELVELSGYFRKWVNPAETADPYFSDDDDKISLKSGISVQSSQVQHFRLPQTDKTVFVATGRLATPQLLRELPVVHQSQSEFTSRHSLEWKFLFVDHRAPPIIGYLTFELLGTSGYDYYHVDDLEQVAVCHESLMQTGECTSCYYRFLTKGQQWIWLQTRYYITYHQWNSKPEFIVATHKVVNYKEVLNQASQPDKTDQLNDSNTDKQSKTHSFRSGSPTWSSKSSLCGSDRTGFASSSRMSQENNSDIPVSSVAQQAYRKSRLCTPRQHSSIGEVTDSMAGLSEDMSCEEQLPDNSDTYSVTSADKYSGVRPSGRSPRSCEKPFVDPCTGDPDQSSPDKFDLPPASPLVLTAAQVALQHQLKTKHAELSRRIALQQAELTRLGDQLSLTFTQSAPGYNGQQQQLGQQQAAAPPQSPQQLQRTQQQQPNTGQQQQVMYSASDSGQQYLAPNS